MKKYLFKTLVNYSYYNINFLNFVKNLKPKIYFNINRLNFYIK